MNFFFEFKKKMGWFIFIFKKKYLLENYTLKFKKKLYKSKSDFLFYLFQKNPKRRSISFFNYYFSNKISFENQN